jgi:hypothetical protein
LIKLIAKAEVTAKNINRETKKRILKKFDSFAGVIGGMFSGELGAVGGLSEAGSEDSGEACLSKGGGGTGVAKT